MQDVDGVMYFCVAVTGTNYPEKCISWRLHGNALQQGIEKRRINLIDPLFMMPTRAITTENYKVEVPDSLALTSIRCTITKIRTRSLSEKGEDKELEKNCVKGKRDMQKKYKE